MHSHPPYRERAYAQCMDQWHKPIYEFLRTMLGNHEDAADATQETFIQVVRSIRSFRKESKFSTWLYSVARRKGLDTLRGRKQRMLRLAHQSPEQWSNHFTADPYFNGTEAQLQLHAAVQALPERQREVFVLRYFQELPYAEISQLTGASEGAVKASFFHAKHKVQEAITSFETLNLSLSNPSNE